MNILFTSVGRRVELIQEFYKAADNLNIHIKIIGVDYSESAPALFFCDVKRKICRIADENYIPQLMEICIEEKVDCLIPTIDTDLLLLSKYKEKFESNGTKVLVSATDKIGICRDKRLTSKYFISLGLKSPISYSNFNDYVGGYPAFIKPIDGSSSIDAYKVDSYEDLCIYANKISKYVIQPYIDGREFTVDIFCDYKGNPVYITPRERLAVRSGEVLKTQIVQDEQIISEMKKLIADFKPCGQITVQLIKDKRTGENYYIEINPRFGGGAPLSIKAGANSAEAILRMLSGKSLSYCNKAAKDKAIFCRFDQSICINEE